VLKRLVENMKDKVNGSLLADYSKFKNERTRKLVRWELLGLEDIVRPSVFSLGVNGTSYACRQENSSRLKSQLSMSMTFDLPPVLSFIPEDVHRNVAETVRPSI
ncbi:hypothetical protein Tco_1306598, partial [Tanacetum coccineum]